ncbi:MAG: HD domain-containing protein [Clostridiales bacterium]|jgi:exopolyphosphatase/guanosine-5'-triphosphate,3'-diphosphate pyrophosphatase|nr:HD domain-containing protein [Clostridiales bacterium]
MNKPKTFGVINLGSNELNLRIAQRENSKMKFIETLRYPLSLGRDTFNMGKVNFEKVVQACEVINNFLQVLSEYGVEDYSVIATTAIREATNRNYILDQIKIKTGVEINVFDDTQEKVYIYKIMLHLLDKAYKQSSMLVYIGSANIGFNILQNEKIIFTQNINLGALRVFEVFEDIQDYSREFYKIVDDYIESFTDSFSNLIKHKISYFIAAGSEISLIGDLCGVKAVDSFLVIPKEGFLKLFDNVKHKTVENICSEYNISLDRAEILLPALCLYKNLFKFTNAKEIIAPLVFLTDSICFEKLFNGDFQKVSDDINRNALSYAKTIAAKYSANIKHYEFVEKYALMIFDRLKKVHGLYKGEKLILNLAAVLHDVGHYIESKGHYAHSYNIIKASAMLGVSDRDKELIANISFFHSNAVPAETYDNYRGLGQKDKVLVAKLAAILRMADALDCAHRQKFKEIDVKVEGGELVFTLNSNRNTELEQWALKTKGKFFEEVFGLKIVIRLKRVN